MIYLALNVVFASAFTLIIKWVGNRRDEDVVTVGAINYIVAALLIAPWLAVGGTAGVSTHAVFTGAVMGACYFIAYFFVVHAVQQIGASSATVVGGLSILLPIVCGAALWNERPNAYQTAGIALAIVALSLIGAHGKGRSEGARWRTPVVLIGFFSLAGAARLSQQAFKHGSPPDQRPTFLIAAFTVAAIPSVMLLLSRRKRISRRELAFGVAMGSANILQLDFMLKALQHLPGYLVFPIGSAGGLVLTSLVATQLLEEKLSGKTCTGIAVASLALVLLNWLPA